MYHKLLFKARSLPTENACRLGHALRVPSPNHAQWLFRVIQFPSRIIPHAAQRE